MRPFGAVPAWLAWLGGSVPDVCCLIAARGSPPESWVDSLPSRAKLDYEFESSNTGKVDPNPRITLDDLGEHVVAVWAAEHDAGASVEVRGSDRSGCSAAATGPDRGCHLDGEHLLKQPSNGVAVQHQLVHVTVPWVRSVRF